ncbi:MAG: hypothetical protein ACPLZD_00185 [Candidatus Saccharicenans sp.]|nr:hypothetical protein [Candidatus Aminicenantes bacterium]
MKTYIIILTLISFLASGIIFLIGPERLNSQQKEQSDISAAKLQAAREKAEYYDQQGDYTRALQYYFECIRQADGLKKKEAAAWARNNAAYMLIKQHWKDPTTDLQPAKQLLEEALALEGISSECQQKIRSNLQYALKFVRD